VAAHHGHPFTNVEIVHGNRWEVSETRVCGENAPRRLQCPRRQRAIPACRLPWAARKGGIPALAGKGAFRRSS
jgi:hypothetical protein